MTVQVVGILALLVISPPGENLQSGGNSDALLEVVLGISLGLAPALLAMCVFARTVERQFGREQMLVPLLIIVCFTFIGQAAYLLTWHRDAQER